MAEPEPMTDAELTFLRSHVKTIGGDYAAEYVARLIARLDQAEARGAWRPIESAPITAAGDYAIHMLLTDGETVCVGYRIEPDTEYDPRGEEEFIDHKGGWVAPRPTNWQPLPAPPRAGGEK